MKILLLVAAFFFNLALAEEWAPDFLIVGAQKGGTSALYNLIIQHPKIVKQTGEIHFFDNHFEKGVEWYKKQFPPCPAGSIVGEKSTYMLHPLVPQRIHALFPKIKIMMILRNPVERAYSNYWFNVRKKLEFSSFEEAIQKELEQLAKGAVPPRLYSYLSKGNYADQIKSFLALFPREQILIISATDLREHPKKTLNRVYAFLGLSSFSVFVRDPHSKSDYPPMDPQMRKQLAEYFEPFNRQLEELLEVTFNWR